MSWHPYHTFHRTLLDPALSPELQQFHSNKHGSHELNSMDEIQGPSHFFKVILPETLEAKMLKIPDAFVEHFNGFPISVVIQNKMGKLWPVSVGYICNEVFFQHGWENFVRDNCVECGDFLVFNYDGDHKFDVMIFGRSACEKIKSGNSVGMDKEVKIEEDDIVGVDVSDDQNDSESNEEDSDDSENYAGEEEEVEDTAAKEEEEAATTISMTRGKKKCGNNGGSKKRAAKKDGVREGANDVLAGVDVRKYVQRKNPYFVVKRRNHKGDMHIGEGSKKNASVKARAPQELDKLLTREEVRKYVHPQNPYFVSELRNSRNSKLFVPSYVLRDFGIQLAEHITFHDELKRKWPGRVICWKDGRTWITGWGKVCRWNKVEKYDLCICEFPQAGGRKNIILVHIHRGASSQSQPINQEPNQADQ